MDNESDFQEIETEEELSSVFGGGGNTATLTGNCSADACDTTWDQVK